MNRRKSAIGSLAIILILVATVFSLLFFVFQFLDGRAVFIANLVAPGSLNTGDFYIFSQLQTFSAAIVAFCMLILVVDLSKRGST